MIKDDRKVKVYLTEKMSVALKSPVSGRTYRMEKADEKDPFVKIKFEEIEAIFITHGGRKLYDKYLLIKDSEVVEELDLIDKTSKDEDSMRRALSEMSEFKFDKFLDELSEDSYLKFAKMAVEMKINDLNKIKKIKLKTNYDILPSILNDDVKFEPKKEDSNNDSKEEKKSLEFNFDDLKKTELKEIAKELDINVGNSLKATIIDKLKDENEKEAKELAKEYL